MLFFPLILQLVQQGLNSLIVSPILKYPIIIDSSSSYDYDLWIIELEHLDFILKLSIFQDMQINYSHKRIGGDKVRYIHI